jgi:hypothetical protein
MREWAHGSSNLLSSYNHTVEDASAEGSCSGLGSSLIVGKSQQFSSSKYEKALMPVTPSRIAHAQSLNV